jgi:hypothetical protein
MTQSPETQIPSPAQEVAHLAWQCSMLLRENVRLRVALENIALLKKDRYALTSNDAYCAIATAIHALGMPPAQVRERRRQDLDNALHLVREFIKSEHTAAQGNEP